MGYLLAVRTPHTSESDLAWSIGSAIRETRAAVRWTQRELAARLGTNLAAVQRLEGGRQPHVNAPLATAALRLLGIRLTLDANTAGLSGRRDQRDLVHARCCGYVARHLGARDWAVETEVEIGEGRYRGWIDLLAYRASDDAGVVFEIKTEIDDLGRIQRSVGWYEREAWHAARRLGWRVRSMVSAVLVLASRENDSRTLANAELLRGAFPDRARELGPWLVDSTVARPKRAIAMIDPRSRRHDWLRSATVDGRRSPAPYADYRAAAAALGSP
jgi:transcriptional regulator with XRE-family HTH domain